MNRPDSRSWLRGKAAGDAVELAIAKFLRQKGFDVLKTVGEASYDLSISARIEIKHDLKAADTGNIAVEIAYKGKPSGLTTTTALWWLHVAGASVFACKVHDLRAWLDRTHFPTREIGDGRQSRCVLVPVDDFRRQKFVTPLNVGGVTDGA